MSEFLDKAFSTHANIKNKLRKSILGEEITDPNVIRQDNVCVVGQWIHGAGGQKHHSSELFQKFRKIHAEFHQAAYDAMLVNQQGDRQKALDDIETGNFNKKSQEIQSCITAMKKDPAFAE